MSLKGCSYARRVVEVNAITTNTPKPDCLTGKFGADTFTLSTE